MRKISFFTLMVLMLMPLCMYGQNRLTMSFVDANGRAVRQLEATMGEEFTEPTLMIQPSDAQVRVTYSSANERVATVDMMSGEVTLVSAGNTTIIAQSGQTADYYAAQAQYSLIVNAAQDTTPVIEPTCPDAYFFVNGAQVTSLTLKVGESVSVPMLMTAAGSLLSGRPSVQDPTIATVSADNMIHGLKTGNTTLFVSTVSTVNGSVLTCDYSLNLIVEAAAPQKQSPELSWSDTIVYAELGVPVTAPVLNNPHNVPMNKIESQNPNVAEVSEDGSVLTIKGVGDAMIFAESFETNAYYAQSVRYSIHVRLDRPQSEGYQRDECQRSRRVRRRLVLRDVREREPYAASEQLEHRRYGSDGSERDDRRRRYRAPADDRAVRCELDQQYTRMYQGRTSAGRSDG